MSSSSLFRSLQIKFKRKSIVVGVQKWPNCCIITFSLFIQFKRKSIESQMGGNMNPKLEVLKNHFQIFNDFSLFVFIRVQSWFQNHLIFNLTKMFEILFIQMLRFSVTNSKNSKKLFVNYFFVIIMCRGNGGILELCIRKKWTNNLLDVEIPRKCKSKLVF